MLSLFLLLPFLGIIALNLPLKGRRDAVAFLYTLWLSIGQAIVVLFNPGSFWQKPDFWGGFFNLGLYADNLTFVMLLSIGIVVSTAACVGWQTISDHRQRLNFYNLILIALIGMNGTVMLTDIFSLYVFPA